MKPSPQGPYFSQHPVLRTNDLSEARFKVSQTLCDHRLNLRGRDAQLSVSHNSVRGQHVTVNYLSYGAEVEVDPGLFGSFYLFQIPLSGKARVTHRGDEMIAHTRAATVLNPDRSAQLHWDAQCSKLLFQIDRDFIENVAQTSTGVSLPGPIRFDMEVDLKTPCGRQLHRIFITCADAIERGALFQDTLSTSDLRVEYDLAYALLTLQGSNISHIIARSEGGARPREIRRALEFIHEYLSEPITIVDIANAAEINVRTLQKGFQRMFSQTPVQVLRNARLDAARYKLLARRNAPSVTETAVSCGFSHLGRFSHHFRDRFGQAPSDVLV